MSIHKQVQNPASITFSSKVVQVDIYGLAALLPLVENLQPLRCEYEFVGHLKVSSIKFFASKKNNKKGHIPY